MNTPKKTMKWWNCMECGISSTWLPQRCARNMMFFEKTASAPFKFEYLQNGRIKTSTEERKWEKELLKKKIGS